MNKIKLLLILMLLTTITLAGQTWLYQLKGNKYAYSELLDNKKTVTTVVAPIEISINEVDSFVNFEVNKESVMIPYLFKKVNLYKTQTDFEEPFITYQLTHGGRLELYFLNDKLVFVLHEFRNKDFIMFYINN